MTDEKKVANGRNSRGSQQLQNFDLAAAHVNIAETNATVVKTSEEKLQDVTGNLLRSPDAEIDPSIYQTDVVTGDQTTAMTTTIAPDAPSAPAAAAAAAAEPAADAPTGGAPDAPAATTPESAATETMPSADPEQATPTAPAPAPGAAAEEKPADQPAMAEGMETTKGPTVESEGKVDPSQATDESKVTDQADETEQAKTPDEKAASMGDMEDTNADEKSVRSPRSVSGDRKTSTTGTTTEAPPKDPYQITIPIERKINKRTQRKLWEEIEKRKPLIPKYVERHIQKYAKPPFELWGCKFKGKGSCYGCGG